MAERHPRAAKRALTPSTKSPQKKRQKTCVELFAVKKDESPSTRAGEEMPLYPAMLWEETEQERRDSLLAKELQEQLNQEAKSERMLRSKQPASTQRQPTIRETLRRGSLTDM